MEKGITDILVDSMARSLWVCAWADWDERFGGESRAGQELMDVAPATPALAWLEAAMLLGRFVEKNASGYGPSVMMAQAFEADGVPWAEFCANFYNGSQAERAAAASYVTDFGHCLVVMALGYGVGWFDDHALCDLRVPRLEIDISEFFYRDEWPETEYARAYTENE